MVLVFSANANHSPQIKREVERAVNKGIPIIPLRIENISPSLALEYFISSQHWLDAFTRPLERHLRYLAEVIKKILTVPRQQPTPGEGSGTNQQSANAEAKMVVSDFAGSKASGTIAKVKCAVCGQRNDPSETFECKECKRDYLCIEHLVKERRCCDECASKLAKVEKGRAEAEQKEALRKKEEEAALPVDISNEATDLALRAVRGECAAQFELGEAFTEGKRVPENDKEAVKWYRKAAEQGHADAQSKLNSVLNKMQAAEKSENACYCVLFGILVLACGACATWSLRWYWIAPEGFLGGFFSIGVFVLGDGKGDKSLEMLKWPSGGPIVKGDGKEYTSHRSKRLIGKGCALFGCVLFVLRLWMLYG